MTGFTFSAEQVRSAPPDVRRWIEHQIAAALAAGGQAEARREAVQPGELAACSPAEMAKVFSLISGNILAVRVFFELGRDGSPSRAMPPPYHALDVGEMMRHTQLADRQQFVECLGLIAQAAQRARNDPESVLFATDNQGHLFVHETTHRSIRGLWDQLVSAHAVPAARGLAEPAEAAPYDGAAPGPVVPDESAVPRPEYAFGAPQRPFSASASS